MKSSYVFLALRVIVALLLLQTQFYHLIGAEGSVALFTTLSLALTGGVKLETAMRVGTGIVELVALVLILRKKKSSIATGALLAGCTKTGMMVALLSVAERETGGDPVQFSLALVALVLSLVILFRFRGSLPFMGKFT